jgi:PIN domain nuclease of toxin-antitoxin system
VIALVDTQLVLWAAATPMKLSAAARSVLENADVGLAFSAASIWEVAIKAGLGREDFDVDPRRLRRGLLDQGWKELSVQSEHAVAVADLPPIHKDPFDRILLAQAHVEGFTLVTTDDVVAKYPGAVRKV